MTEKHQIQLFEEKKVRTIWDDQEEKWYFSVVDVCQVLAESKDYQTARKYWNKLKQRLKEEGNETVTNCHQLRLQKNNDKQYTTRDRALTRRMFENGQGVANRLFIGIAAATIFHGRPNGDVYCQQGWPYDTFRKSTGTKSSRDDRCS